MKNVRAFAPANISLIFKVVPHKDPAKMGSLGIGFTVNKGVIVTVKKSKKTEVFFNKKSINLPTVLSVVKALTNEPLHISIESPLPLGSGFGISGASALASALAINKLFNLHGTRLELAKIAHTAEVENKTGLGDIVNQYYGGFFVKFYSSSSFIVQSVPIVDIPVYCISYGKLLTSSVLQNSDNLKNINGKASTALRSMKKLLRKSSIQFGEILSIARIFARESGLLTSKSVQTLIETIEKRDGHASMIMLGEGVVSDIPFEGALKLKVSESACCTVD